MLVGLSLLFTTLYQWGWVTTFLTPGKLPVATAIFLAFPILGFVSLGLAGRTGALDTAAESERRTWFEEVASLNAALPLLFAVFMATSQVYGEHPALMFAFLFCVDAGLFAVALWRRQPMLHVLGGVATLVVFVAWMSMLYGGTAPVDVASAAASPYPANLGYVSLFVVLYLASGLTARRGPVPPRGSRPACELRRAAAALRLPHGGGRRPWSRLTSAALRGALRPAGWLLRVRRVRGRRHRLLHRRVHDGGRRGVLVRPLPD